MPDPVCGSEHAGSISTSSRTTVRRASGSALGSVRPVARMWSLRSALHTSTDDGADHASHHGAEQRSGRDEDERVEARRAVGCLAVEANTEHPEDEPADHPER